MRGMQDRARGGRVALGLALVGALAGCAGEPAPDRPAASHDAPSSASSSRPSESSPHEGAPDATASAPSPSSTSATGQGSSPSSGSSPEASPSTSGREDDEAPRAFSVVTTGDMLTHYVLQERADELQPGPGFAFDGMLTEVEPVLAGADLAVCGQETPISPENEDLTASKGTFVFNAPREIAEAMAAAGYDACSTASNHTLDKGLRGVADTRAVLEENGIAPVGPQASEGAGPGHPVLVDAGGATVGLLAYSYNVKNALGGTTVPGMEWMNGHMMRGAGAEGMIADARRARRMGADVVMVSIHWGAEYDQEPNDEQREIARTVLASGEVDAIAGSHPHVVQPCETIDGRTVAYSMGNFLSEQGPNRYPSKPITTQDGVLLRWTFTPEEGADGVTWEQELEYQPTFVTRPDFVIAPATPDHLPDSYRRTVDTMSSLGKGRCNARPMTPKDWTR